MSKVLTESEVIKMMKETYIGKLKQFLEEIDDKPYKGQETNIPLVSPMLKVRHKKSGILYTVRNKTDSQVFLLTPEGNEHVVSQEEFKKDYELD